MDHIDQSHHWIDTSLQAEGSGYAGLSSICFFAKMIHADFANMLNEMRVGKLSQKSISTFHSLSRKLSFEDDLEATEL